MRLFQRGGEWARYDHIDFAAAAERVLGVVRRTPLLPMPCDDERIELRCKLENRQETGSFKARGAWNQVSQLTAEERERGVIATSSGNHGRALAWAAERAGVPATVVMPADAYPNKVSACREHGAEVILADGRKAAEDACRELVQAGLVLIHPFDSERTVQGTGTIGLELVEDWPEVEVVVIPVGGGGLISGTSVALRRHYGAGVAIYGAEPAGAPSMTLGLDAGGSALLAAITTEVQGLCPLASGELNIAICSQTLDGVALLEDEQVYASMRRLVAAGETVEPAGAAASAVVFSGLLPEELLAGRSAADPLRVATIVSGGNPPPDWRERIGA